jgi:hypothetical protein
MNTIRIGHKASVTVRGPLQRGALGFAEEALAHVVVAGQLRAAEEVIREAVGFCREERKRMLAPLIGTRATLEQEVEGPLANSSFCCEVRVARGSIAASSGRPILSREEIFGEHAHIAQCQAQRLICKKWNFL